MIAIVGAGITGLTLAHQLAGYGVPFVVLEAADRPGGVIRSGRVHGHLLEWGPQRTRLTQGLAELVDELGLHSELITAPRGLPLFVYRRGKLRRVPFSPAEFLRTDLLSWRGKLRLLVEPLSRGARDDESVATFLTRKLGREAYESLVGPLYGGLYASDPAEMVVGLSLAHVLREVGVRRSLLVPLLRRRGTIAPPDACSFREGMQALPSALYERHRAHVRLGSPAHGLTRAGSGWVVAHETETLRAQHVVITTDAHAAAALLAPVAPEAARRVGSLVYNPLAVVHLYSHTRLVGLGYQVSFAERSYTRGVTFNDSLFGREGVYTAYLGGAKAPEVAEWPDARLGQTAVREFRAMTGYDAEVLAVERERMPAWDRSWAALRGLHLPERLHVAASWQSRPGLPGRLLQAQRLAAELAPAGAPRRR